VASIANSFGDRCPYGSSGGRNVVDIGGRIKAGNGADTRAQKAAALVDVPSPLAGEGCSAAQRKELGEG